METQSKLLRVIQEREVELVGGKQAIKVDARLTAATNCNLEEEVEEGLKYILFSEKRSAFIAFSERFSCPTNVFV